MPWTPVIVPERWIGPRGGDLKIVVLDRPYDTFELPQTQNLFGKVAAMKIAGYLARHPYGTLPVDTGDFIGTHLLLCERTPGSSLLPLMGMKFITAEHCKIHRIEFPAWHLVNPRTQPDHHQGLRDLLENVTAKNETVAYSASWTMDQSIRADKGLAWFCKYLNIALFYFYAKTYGIQNLVAGAVVKFKVQEWKRFLGYQQLNLQGQPLGVLNYEGFFDLPVLLMHLREFRPEAIYFARGFQRHWDERLIIDQSSILSREAKSG